MKVLMWRRLPARERFRSLSHNPHRVYPTVGETLLIFLSKKALKFTQVYRKGIS